MNDQFPEEAAPNNPVWITLQSPDGPPDLSSLPDGYPGALLSGAEAVSRLEEYESAGRHLRTPDIPEDEVITADGVLFQEDWGNGDRWGVIRDRLDPGEAIRLSEVGVYTVNDGQLAYVNEHGRLMVTRDTADNRLSVRGANYTPGHSVPVPFSNGRVPAEGSIANLQLRLFTELDQQDAVLSSPNSSPTGLVHEPSYVISAEAVAATRGSTLLETEAGHDRRVTDEMDPDFAGELEHRIQALRDEIALHKMSELNS